MREKTAEIKLLITTQNAHKHTQPRCTPIAGMQALFLFPQLLHIGPTTRQWSRGSFLAQCALTLVRGNLIRVRVYTSKRRAGRESKVSRLSHSRCEAQAFLFLPQPARRQQQKLSHPPGLITQRVNPVMSCQGCKPETRSDTRSTPRPPAAMYC